MTQPPLKERPEIMLICLQDKHYLVEGEEHMRAMVMGDAPYPTPILCVNFTDIGQVVEVFGEGFDPTKNWRITGRAITRLRQEGALHETDA